MLRGAKLKDRASSLNMFFGIVYVKKTLRIFNWGGGHMAFFAPALQDTAIQFAQSDFEDNWEKREIRMHLYTVIDTEIIFLLQMEKLRCISVTHTKVHACEVCVGGFFKNKNGAYS